MNIVHVLFSVKQGQVWIEGRDIGHEFICLGEVSKGTWGAWSFRIALRSEPIDTSGALHPFVNFGFGLESLDATNFGSGTVGLDLPIALCDALRLENDVDPRGFAHRAEYDPFGQGRKPESGLPCSN
jgi:hypothetical protein